MGEALVVVVVAGGMSYDGLASSNNNKRQRLNEKGNVVDCKEDAELEEFEVGATEFVSKKEAKEKYCLPDGTLDVCAFKEKDNPHQKKWTPMKLYKRSEVRMRSRERFGGVD